MLNTTIDQMLDGAHLLKPSNRDWHIERYNNLCSFKYLHVYK